MACGPCKKNFPPAPTLARNAAVAAGRVAIAAVRGGSVKVSPAQEAKRLEVCRTCDRVKPSAAKPDYLRCLECGCWLNGKFLAKASLATETCPLKRWEALL